MHEASPIQTAQPDSAADRIAGMTIRAAEVLADVDARLREIETLLAERRVELLTGKATIRDVLELQAERSLLREFRADAHHLSHAARKGSV